MKNIRKLGFLAGFVALAGCAQPNYSFSPQEASGQTVRFDRGTPTTLADGSEGSIQITPLGVSPEGHFAFGMAVFNKSAASRNFGLENVQITDAGGLPVVSYNRDALIKEARVRANTRILLAALAGAAAAYSANQAAYSHSSGYVAGPGGVATFQTTSYDPAIAVAGTAAAGAATGYAISSIKNSMDATLDHLNGSVMETSTVDTGRSYGGEVFFDLPKTKDWPRTLIVSATWGDDRYSFKFNVSQQK